MARLVDVGICSINEILAQMGNIAQKSLEAAVDSYLKSDRSRKLVFDLSEKLNRLEDEIGDIAVELIAQYQPIATDLRFIRASLEIAYLLWRCGRHTF